jgi:hypothetical protein
MSATNVVELASAVVTQIMGACASRKVFGSALQIVGCLAYCFALGRSIAADMLCCGDPENAGAIFWRKAVYGSLATYNLLV